MKKISVLWALFLLTGCWKVTQDKITLRYSPFTGAGTFTRSLSGLTCEEKGKDCSVEGLGDLEKAKGRYEKILARLGAKGLKGELKAAIGKTKYDGTLSGKYASLTQLPFFKEVRVSYQEVPGNRTDQVLEFHFEPKGEFKADNFGFELVSTDPSATLEEVSPAGKMDASHRSVAWDSLPVQGEESVLRVRLKGYELP